MASSAMIVIDVAGKSLSISPADAEELYKALGVFFNRDNKDLDIKLDTEETKLLLETVLKKIDQLNAAGVPVVYIPWWNYKWPWWYNNIRWYNNIPYTPISNQNGEFGVANTTSTFDPNNNVQSSVTVSYAVKNT